MQTSSLAWVRITTMAAMTAALMGCASRTASVQAPARADQDSDTPSGKAPQLPPGWPCQDLRVKKAGLPSGMNRGKSVSVDCQHGGCFATTATVASRRWLCVVNDADDAFARIRLKLPRYN
jgi:hypothetical protein